MNVPTAQMHCVSPEKAEALAERLRTESGVPAAFASSEGSVLRAPIDNPGFALMVAAIAEEGGYASEQAVMAFQQAAITHAEAARGEQVPVEERTVVLFCDRCETEIREPVTGAGSAARLAGIRERAAGRGWHVAPGTDLCPNCAFSELFGNVPVRFWVCPIDEHRERRGVVTVRWKDGVAHCTAPGCQRTSAAPAD